MDIASHLPRHAARLSLSVLTVVLAGGLAASAYAQTTTTTVNPNQGTVVVKKFYDANANGRRDTGEPWLSGSTSGWPVTLTTPGGSSSTKRTTATFSGLNGGSGYWVQEATPLETNWVQTAPTVNGVPVNPKSVKVIPCKTVTVYFGNYCKKGSGGKTPGFWSNKNGEAKMADAPDGMAPELGELSTLNLVDALGNPFDPVDYGSFRTWLVNRDAVNMAYQLSAHLAAMALNVEAGYVNGDSFYIPCGCTVNELLADANAALAADGYTPSGDPNRTLQEQLKNWLDALNNGATIVSATPCKRTFYTTY